MQAVDVLDRIDAATAWRTRPVRSVAGPGTRCRPGRRSVRRPPPRPRPASLSPAGRGGCWRSPISAQSGASRRRTTGWPGRHRPGRCRAPGHHPAVGQRRHPHRQFRLDRGEGGRAVQDCSSQWRSSCQGGPAQCAKWRVPVKYSVTFGSFGRGDGLVVTDRAARLNDGAHPGRDEHLRARRRTGRTRPRPRPPRRARSPARATASVQESTRFTCPMPTPTVAPSAGEQDRVRLDRPHRPPGEREVGQRRLVGRRHRPAGSSYPGRRRARRSVGRLQQHAAGHRPSSRRRDDSAAAPATSNRRFLRLASISSASSSNDGATITSVKIVGDVLGHLAR